MTCLGRRGPLILVLAILPAAAAAQVDETIHLNPLEWEARIDFDGTRRSTDNETTSDLEVSTGVRFKQSGYSLDPRIFKFSVEVEPEVSRGEFSGSTQDETRDGFFLNYNINANALQGTPGPFGVDGQFSKTTDTIDGSLGNRNEFDLETRSLGVNWKTRIFPSTLSYSERAMEQTFESGLTSSVSKRDDVLRAINFRGRSRKLSLNLERNWLDDLTDRDFDYSTNKARADHRFEWGKGSRLTTHVDFFDRNGFNEFERFKFDETADIQHTEDLSSATSYQFSSFSQQGTTIENAGSFSLTHDLYDSLTTTGHVSGSLRQSDTLDELEYEPGVDLNYRKKIFWGGRFNAGAGGAYRITDRDSSSGFQSVADESHLIPTTGLVNLNRRFVDGSSVIVTDTTGALVLTLGTDYTVSPAGADLVEVFILPGGLLGPGDTFLASYRFELQPSVKFSTIPYHYRASVDFGWINVFHRTSISDESLISGAGESFLIDREDRTTGVQLRWDGSSVRTTASAQLRSQSTGSFDTDSLDFDQSLVYNFSRRAGLTLSISEVFSESTNRDTDLYTGDLSIRWLPWPNLTLRPHLGYWTRTDRGSAITGGSREEQFVDGGLDVRWFLRQLEISVRYNHTVRDGDTSQSTEDRVMFTLIRRSL